MRNFQYCLVMILYLQGLTGGQAGENLLENPGAETTISIRDYPEKKQMGLKCPGGLTASGWGLYRGAGKGIWGVTDKCAHSGKNSMFVTFKDWHWDKKKNKKVATMALLVGEGNGYTGNFAIPVKPGTDYEFSVWVKGNITFIIIRILIWDDKGKRFFHNPRRMRKNGFGLRHRGRGSVINPKPNEWIKLSGEFTTPKNAAKMAVWVGFNSPILLSSGQTLYVDDAFVGKKEGNTK